MKSALGPSTARGRSASAHRDAQARVGAISREALDEPLLALHAYG